MRLARRLPGLALAAMMLVVAAPAAAQAPAAPPPLFEQFREYCMDTKWDKDAALKRADARGWAEIPESLFAAEMEAMDEIKMTSVSARIFVQDRKMVMLMVGAGIMEDGGSTTNVRLCGLMTFGNLGEELKADAIAHVRAPPIEGDGANDPFAMWMYTQKGDRREFLDGNNPRKLAKAMEAGQVNILMAGSEEEMSMLMLMQPTTGFAQ